MKGKQGVQADASGYNRREFLVNTSKIAGALLALPLLSKAQEAAAKTAALEGKPLAPARSTARRTIGVLLPQSAAYPQMSANFLAGMNLYFSQAGLQNVKLVTADVGACCGNAEEQVEAMLSSQKLDLMVGMVNPTMASSLRKILAAHNTALVATGLGENLARRNESNPYIFHHTLGMWEANYALGKWAATTYGRNAIIASSFYDSGYDTLYAFQMGFEAAGGRIISSHITHQPAGDNGLTALMSAIKVGKPNVVFASYYGQAAVDLLNAYARAGLSRSVPLVGTAFLVDQAVIKSVGSAAAGVTTSLSWSANLDTAENRAFVSAYQNKTGKAPDAFAALGYETAGLIASAIDRAAGGSLRDALAAASFTGPRGTLGMNATSQSTSGAHYLQKAQQQGINVRTAVVAALGAGSAADGQVAALRDDVKTGWMSSYLCG